MAERRYLSQTQPAGLIGALVRRGHDVRVIDPSQTARFLGDPSWLLDLDLLVCRGRSWALLSLLGWAEALGVPTVNRRAAIGRVHNKAEMSAVLAAAGVPTPRTFLGGVEELAQRIERDAYPVLLKPVFGDNGLGLRLVRTAEELAALKWPEPFALAQELLASDGFDLKLYAIGDQVWAVKKRSPFLAGGERLRAGQPCGASPLPSTPQLRALALRCGRLFGLEVYGVDCLETPSGPVVIEVNEFPSYSGVEDADAWLAEYLIGRTRLARQRSVR